MKRSSIEFEFYSGNMFEIYLKDYLVTSKLYHPPSPPPHKKIEKNSGLLACLSNSNECIRLWSGRFEVQIAGRSNRTQCCYPLATTTTFQKKAGCPDAMTRRCSQTRYTLRRNM